MEPTRETISLLLVSILGTIALTNSITLFQRAFGNFATALSFLVFVSIWLRFVPGSIAHIRKLERHPYTALNVWFLDITVITIEMMLIVFMAEPSINNQNMFFATVIALLILDVSWVFSMRIGAKQKIRPEPQWIWIKLNIPSMALLSAFLFFNGKLPMYFSWEFLPVSIAITIVFISFAVIDIVRVGPDWFGEPRSVNVSKEERGTHEKYMEEAINEAEAGLREGGIPIGAVLVKNGVVVGRGHNKRIQDSKPMAHAEIECLNNAERRQNYKEAILYSTLMPCFLCAGAIIQFGIRRVVIGESRNFGGAGHFLTANGVRVVDLNMQRCYEMLGQYIRSNKEIWAEDIGKS